MMYNQKLTAAIKCGGKVMREHGETVYLPFGSEYTLFMKNLNNRKARVEVEIDGEDVLDGKGIILDAGGSIDLKRWILDGNWDTGPSFKFVEKTEGIADRRSEKTQDGLIRIKYKFEKEYPVFGGSIYNDVFFKGSPTLYGSNQPSIYNMNIGSSLDGATRSFASTTLTSEPPANDAGFTVKGQETEQKFQSGWIGQLEDREYVMVFQIKGEVGQEKVEKPLLVNTKVECSACTHKNVSTAKFCSECGNNLKY